MKKANEFERDGRKVILLTLPEGEALLEFIERLTTPGERSQNTTFARAIRVLGQQVRFLSRVDSTRP